MNESAKKKLGLVFSAVALVGFVVWTLMNQQPPNRHASIMALEAASERSDAHRFLFESYVDCFEGMLGVVPGSRTGICLEEALTLAEAQGMEFRSAVAAAVNDSGVLGAH